MVPFMGYELHCEDNYRCMAGRQKRCVNIQIDITRHMVKLRMVVELG